MKISIKIWSGVILFVLGSIIFIRTICLSTSLRADEAYLEVIILHIGFTLMCIAVAWNLVVLTKIWAKYLTKNDRRS